MRPSVLWICSISGHARNPAFSVAWSAEAVDPPYLMIFILPCAHSADLWKAFCFVPRGYQVDLAVDLPATYLGINTTHRIFSAFNHHVLSFKIDILRLAHYWSTEPHTGHTSKIIDDVVPHSGQITTSAWVELVGGLVYIVSTK